MGGLAPLPSLSAPSPLNASTTLPTTLPTVSPMAGSAPLSIPPLSAPVVPTPNVVMPEADKELLRQVGKAVFGSGKFVKDTFL